MKTALIIFSFFLSLSLNAADIRTDFHANMFNEDELTALTENKTYSVSNLTLAYKGIGKTMLADFMFLPTSKLSYFNAGKADLEKAIKIEPKNPELRYLRLLIQLNAPFFLNYNDKIASDITFFTNNLKVYQIKTSWKIKFIDNLLGAEELTPQQEVKIKALKKKLT